jgi:hypothetical protein
MNERIETIRRLALKASMETAPEIDVSQSVVYRLSKIPPQPRWPMIFFASGAVTAAAVALLISIPLFDFLSDPWSVCFASTVAFLI